MTAEPSTTADVAEHLHSLVDTLDRLPPDDLTIDDCVHLIAVLTKGPEGLTTVIRSTVGLLELRISDLIPPRTAVPVAGHTARWSPGSPKRSEWANGDLVRAVLDSRLIEPGTGEVVDESPADKLIHVFSLSGSSARITALRERGLDPDDFCHVERAPNVEVL